MAELDTETAAAMRPRVKKAMTPRAAMAWFLRDMAEVSGYAVTGWSEGKILSLYATYRPMLTAPDPWYYAGLVALEACKVVDLFESPYADELMREMFSQMDSVIGRFNTDCSSLAMMLMGRLGKGALLMHRKVPDNLLAKIMLILLGSPSSAKEHMPAPTAHKQLKAALKLGAPVWWKMFDRWYKVRIPGMPEPRPKLVLSKYAPPRPQKLGDNIEPPATTPDGNESRMALKNILKTAFDGSELPDVAPADQAAPAEEMPGPMEVKSAAEEEAPAAPQATEPAASSEMVVDTAAGYVRANHAAGST